MLALVPFHAPFRRDSWRFFNLDLSFFRIIPDYFEFFPVDLLRLFHSLSHCWASCSSWWDSLWFFQICKILCFYQFFFGKKVPSAQTFDDLRVSFVWIFVVFYTEMKIHIKRDLESCGWIEACKRIRHSLNIQRVFSIHSINPINFKRQLINWILTTLLWITNNEYWSMRHSLQLHAWLLRRRWFFFYCYTLHFCFNLNNI